MAKEARAGHEERTRFICHLPVPEPKCITAVYKVFSHVEGLRSGPYSIKGYTHSALRPPAFYGAWWSTKRQEWMREKIVICSVDFRIDFNDPAVPEIIANLKEKIFAAYRSIGKPQEEVWVVAQHIVR